jgi:hypothetical protein
LLSLRHLGSLEKIEIECEKHSIIKDPVFGPGLFMYKGLNNYVQPVSKKIMKKLVKGLIFPQKVPIYLLKT